MSNRAHDDEMRQRANRYLWIIVPIAIAGMVGGILWGEIRTPQYRSSALISVPNPSNSMNQEALRATSPTVLEPATAILGFAPEVSVDANENARLLTVTAIASSAADAALSATTVASTYVDTQLGSASQVVADGDVPADPFAPNRQASLLFGTGLGAALGLLTALFLQRQVPNLEAKLDEERRGDAPATEQPRMAQPGGVRLQDLSPANLAEPADPADPANRFGAGNGESAVDQAARSARGDRVRARREQAAAAVEPGEARIGTREADVAASEAQVETREADVAASEADEPYIPGIAYPRYQRSELDPTPTPPVGVRTTTARQTPDTRDSSTADASVLVEEPSSAAASPDPTPPLPTARPAPAADPKPASTPVAKRAPASTQTPAPASNSTPAPTPKPAPTAEPAPAPEPPPTAEPLPTPEPASTPAPAPTPAPARTATRASVAEPDPVQPLAHEAIELEREQARLERDAQRSRHELAISTLTGEHRKEIGELTAAFASERATLRQEIEDATQLSKSSFSSRATLDQSRVTDLEEQVAALEEDRAELRNQLERQRIDAESRLSDEQARFDRSLDNARRDFRSELARHNQSQRATIEDLRQELDRALVVQRQEHEAQLAEQHDEYTAAVEAERTKRDEALESAQTHLRSELKRQKEHEQQELRQQAESQRETIETLRQLVSQSSNDADQHGLAAQKLRTQIKDQQRSARHAAETATTQIQNLRDELNAQIRVTQAERERSDGLLADLHRVNEEQSAEADRALAERSRHLAELRESVERQRKYADDRVREISASAEERAREAAQREAELRASISRLERAQAKENR